MKLYYVHALDDQGCEIYTDSQLSISEAKRRAKEFENDEAIQQDLVRIIICAESDDTCVLDIKVNQ